MQFDLNEDQALLRNSTRELLENEAALAESRGVMEESVEGFAKGIYRQLGELGYLGLLLSEEDGGLGPIAFAIVMAEMGRVAFPGPFLDLTLAARTLSNCPGDVARNWQARTAEGEAIVVLARAENLHSSDPSEDTTRYVDGKVKGNKVFVPFGAEADALLVSTADGLALVPRPGTGWSATPLTTIDHAQRFVSIEFDDEASLVADVGKGAELLADSHRLGALGASAQMVGIMERVLEITVEYTSEREAFGAPIGSFQALQHRCADMLIQTESARAATFRAAWAEEAGSDDSGYLTSVAKAWAGPAGRFVCGQGIQLLGGVGFTWEYDPHIYLKRLKTLEQFHGSTSWHVESALSSAPMLASI
ncbi:MAG: acyl-CoA/acyl-ACP dehydrogenase [Myxococcota bacterium]|nr:acyl-CoA/acyl-ACP dehydrogenase [Myxococcota bacterium]